MSTRIYPGCAASRKPLAAAIGWTMALACYAAMHAAPARAQGAALEEIIVTAQKRQENVQDIPATVNAVTASQIADFRVVSLDDVQALTPGVLMVRNDARRQSVTIRGITADPDNNAAAPISYYWNDAPLRSQQAFTTFFDIERLEVLRGPQGTLQGRTDPAGAILIHTKRPDLQAVSGTVRQSFSDNSGMQTEAGVSVPLVKDVFGVRLAGLWDESDGSEYENIVNGQDESQQTGSYRISLDWMPREALEISLVHERSDVDAEVPEGAQGDVGNVINAITAQRNGASFVFNQTLTGINNPNALAGAAFAAAPSAFIPGQTNAGALVQTNIARRAVAPTWLAGVSLDDDDRQSIQLGRNDLDMRSEFTVLRAVWELDNHTLTSIGSLKDWRQNNWLDMNFAYLSPVAQMQNTHTEAEDWSQEIRFASNDNAFWNYTAGMFWEDFDGFTNNYTDLGGPFAMYGSMAGIRNGDMVQHLQIPNGRETLAFFLHNRFELSDATNLQLGIRWQEIDGEQIVRAAVIDNYAPPAESGPVTNPLLAGALNPRLTSAGVWNIFKGNIRTGDLIPNELQTTEEREWTGGVKLSHYLNDDDMVYASLDRSFRPSGATITPTALSADSLLFDSETSDSLELGYKAMAFDGNLRYSAAAYYQQYSDYLPRASNVNALVATGAGRVPQVVQGGMVFNADATVMGVEVEWTALLGERFQFGGGLSYSEATFDDDELGPCNRPFTPAEIADPTVEIATCDIGGEDVSSQPDWSATLNAEYTLPLSFGELFVRPLLAYTGEREDRLVPAQSFDDYVLVNLYAGVRSDDGAWEGTVWAKNLFDEDVNSVFSNPYFGPLGGNSNFTRAVMVPPRLLGVTVSYNFAGG